jgi:hypothetical protein
MNATSASDVSDLPISKHLQIPIDTAFSLEDEDL